MRRFFLLILILALVFAPNAGALLFPFQQVVAELPKTCPECTDWLNGKNFDPDESAKIQETISETARIHGLTLNEFLIIADKNGLYGLHNGNDGGTVAVNALKPDGSGFSSGQDRVFTFGHESPGHSSGGNSEEYADLMGSYALGAMNLSNWLNGRERLTDSSLSATDWLAAYGDSDFIRYNNAWGNFLAEQKDTHKREDGYDRHALGQKTYEELVATDIAMDERYKDDWGHVTGPVLAMGEVAKGGFELGSLVAQCGISWITLGAYYPEAGGKLWDTAVSLPENIVLGVVQSAEDVFSGDMHQATHGATNLFMVFFPVAKVKGLVSTKGGALSLRAGEAAAMELDASVAAGMKSALPSLDDLSRAASTLNRNQLTDAGRALQKHSSRPGTAFPATDWKPTTLNAAGKSIVDDILTNPQTRIVERTIRENNMSVKVIDAISPDGRGLRFTGDGTRLKGFREP